MKPIYTIDCETDPFEYDRVPKPFAWGLWTGHDYWDFWGGDWYAKLEDRLRKLPAGIIYAHNGGKFDFHYLRRMFRTSKPLVIGARLVSVEIVGGHELRDSFSIIPFPLSKYKKDEIEYSKLESNVRETHKEEIRHYLKNDCVYLREWVMKFWELFGDNLTVGSAGMKELKKYHSFQNLDKMDDGILREFYFGGRVQCFEKGILSGKWKVYDVNSMYPSKMRNELHPVGNEFEIGKKIIKDTCFITAEGHNYGAFPLKKKRDGNSLSFTEEYGVFQVSIHEWKAALDTDTFRPTRIWETYNFKHQSTFSTFVDRFFDFRKRAKDNGDLTGSEFYKFVLNTPYGKFAQNPERYFEYKVVESGIDLSSQNWQPYILSEENDEYEYTMWRRRSTVDRRYNVATSASITGAARASLLRAIVAAKRPVYCDTDSLVCEHLPASLLDDKELGKWKFEMGGDEMCIAGKKMYALYDGGKPTKKFASKGVRLEPEVIRRVASGETVVAKNIAPTFSLWEKPRFITRDIRMT